MNGRGITLTFLIRVLALTEVGASMPFLDIISRVWVLQDSFPAGVNDTVGQHRGESVATLVPERRYIPL